MKTVLLLLLAIVVAVVVFVKPVRQNVLSMLRNEQIEYPVTGGNRVTGTQDDNDVMSIEQEIEAVDFEFDYAF